MTYREALDMAKNLLADSLAEDAAFEARQLLYHSTGLDAAGMLMHYADSIPQDSLDKLTKLCKKRAEGEPLQYILGSWGFHSVSVEVEKGALIPRFDTEVLADAAIDYLSDKREKRVLDLCTGTGCVITAVAKNCGESHKYFALDKYSVPLTLAKKNTKSNGVDVTVLEGDVLIGTGAEGEFDLILCNPPYIKTDDIKGLSKEVRREPVEALDGGKDGLDFYRALCEFWVKRLKKGGMMAVEIGCDQMNEVKSLFEAAGLLQIKILRDTGDNPRVVCGIKSQCKDGN